jgi:hypothetical protein
MSSTLGLTARGPYSPLNADSASNPERLLAIRGLKGKVWFVDSNASSGGNGLSWTGAFQTLQAADTAASADDTVMVAPTHVDTITAAAGLALATAGVTYIGFGNGNRRPQVDFTTAVGADMDIGAAGITMINFRFTSGIDALTGPIDVNAADFTMIDCVTQDVTGQTTDFIATDANADRMALYRWTHLGAAAAGAATAITIVGGDDIVIEDPWIDGNFSTACIENVTTANGGSGVHIYGGQNRPAYLRTRNSADILITLVATSKANIGPGIYGRLADNAANVTECIAAADGQFFNLIEIVNLDGELSLPFNATASTDA